jgi:hypothetical protein
MKHLILVFTWLISVAGYGNIFNVTVTTDGNNPNQLRGAVMAAAAAGAGPHTINIAAGTYNLTMGQISVGNSPITITFVGAGAASTIINMTSTMQDRLFNINPSGTVSNINITFQAITFTGGRLTSDNFGGGTIICGGPDNTMTFNNCVFNANTIAPTAGGNGGALSMQGGGSLHINQCTFSGNTNTEGSGGALYYSLPNTQSGELFITGSVFTNNAVSAINSDGGAIFITVQPALGATTSFISIERNNFIANHANAAGGVGGAIAITNARGGLTNTAEIYLNRFSGNTANNIATSGVGMIIAGAGHVNAYNNWWGCNGGPTSGSGCDKAGTINAGGTGTLSIDSWLQLTIAASAAAICNSNVGNTATITAHFLQNSNGSQIPHSFLSALTGAGVSFTPVLGTISGAQTTIQSDGTATATFTSNGTTGTGLINAIVDNVPNNDPLARASVTINPSPVINTHPLPLARCPGNEATFSVAATGSSLSYAWYKGTIELTDGVQLSGAVIDGAATSTLAIRYPTNVDNSTAYNVVVTGNGCSTRSNNTQLIVPPLAIPNTNATGSRTISANDFSINDASCNRIAKIEPAAMAPVNGVVSATVTIDARQPTYNGQPYVKRHYDITPVANANIATATVTLYFNQAEFDSYNAVTPGTANDLPVGPNDMTGRENLRVTQYHGTGTSPGNYSGWTGAGAATVLISPGGGHVVWNSTGNWWEVTFPVTGFSGFYVTGLIAGPLPVTLHQITAARQQEGISIQWKVSREVEFSHYVVETSTDGRSFATIGTVTATNNTLYSFLHNKPAVGSNFYRLKMVDLNGYFTYSRIISCPISLDGYKVQVLNNPFRQNLELKVEAKENTVLQIQLQDLTGRQLLQKNISVNKGSTYLNLSTNLPANGVYLLRVSNTNFLKIVKVLKAE